MKRLLTFILFLPIIYSQAQNALKFDGNDDYIQCPLPGPTGTASRTVEAWVKISSTFTAQKVILDWGDMLIGGRFTLNIINGIPRIEVGGNGFSASNVISTNVWHHIAATFDNAATSKLKLYVDGLQAAGGNPSVSTATNTTNGINIGRRNDATGHFDGFIDEVRVWNIARSQTQIAADMNTHFCTPFAGLVAYFSFDQGVSGGSNPGLNTLNNTANSLNNGTLTNFSLSGSSSNWVGGASINNLTAAATQTGASISASPGGATYQWLNCSGNTVVSGASQQSYTPTTSGSYSVIITKNGCSDTSNCVTMSVSLDELEASNSIQIFPNPFSNKIQIDLKNSFSGKQTSLQIMTIHGKEVYRINSISDSKIELNMEEMEAGIYIIKISNSSFVHQEKLLKN